LLNDLSCDLGELLDANGELVDANDLNSGCTAFYRGCRSRMTLGKGHHNDLFRRTEC
jgi:hypothetical protein